MNTTLAPSGGTTTQLNNPENSATTTAAPNTKQESYLWVPYVVLLTVLIILTCASFAHFHIINKDKYRGNNKKRTQQKSRKKYRVTFSAKGLPCTVPDYVLQEAKASAYIDSHIRAHQNRLKKRDSAMSGIFASGDPFDTSIKAVFNHQDRPNHSGFMHTYTNEAYKGDSELAKDISNCIELKPTKHKTGSPSKRRSSDRPYKQKEASKSTHPHRTDKDGKKIRRKLPSIHCGSSSSDITSASTPDAASSHAHAHVLDETVSSRRLPTKVIMPSLTQLDHLASSNQ